jgi:prokaryotic ubiquitin-like protein Pup
MAKRERVEKKSTSKREDEPEAEEVKAVDTEAIKAEMDDLLDEIDDVLEQNAEEFVKGYVQKGGE